ncbi:unnamed protein product [Toxocara canis]|uniref:Transposase n=1 Tax=Toxocara canis TaxID=6265 RepID=A0A183V5C8_TOXCA|nr:unnamed protein product [Toxocara canis]
MKRIRKGTIDRLMLAMGIDSYLAASKCDGARDSCKNIQYPSRPVITTHRIASLHSSSLPFSVRSDA